MKPSKSNLSLAVFTNCSANCLEEPTIYDSLASLITAFQDQDFATLHVYVDPEPNIKSYSKYVKKLKGYGFYTVKIKNKEDAYRDALDVCETKYLMVVGDNWYYDDEQINNSLQDFTYWMHKNKLSIFALNDRKNVEMPKTNPLLEMTQFKGKNFCVTNQIKEQPQIVDVLRMKQVMILHDIKESKEILGDLNEIAVYGAYGNIRSVKRLRKESKK